MKPAPPGTQAPNVKSHMYNVARAFWRRKREVMADGARLFGQLVQGLEDPRSIDVVVSLVGLITSGRGAVVVTPVGESGFRGSGLLFSDEALDELDSTEEELTWAREWIKDNILGTPAEWLAFAFGTIYPMSAEDNDELARNSMSGDQPGLPLGAPTVPAFIQGGCLCVPGRVGISGVAPTNDPDFCWEVVDNHRLTRNMIALP